MVSGEHSDLIRCKVFLIADVDKVWNIILIVPNARDGKMLLAEIQGVSK